MLPALNYTVIYLIEIIMFLLEKLSANRIIIYFRIGFRVKARSRILSTSDYYIFRSLGKFSDGGVRSVVSRRHVQTIIISTFFFFTRFPSALSSCNLVHVILASN